MRHLDVFRRRQLFTQSLERRCVMDAAGFEITSFESAPPETDWVVGTLAFDESLIFANAISLDAIDEQDVVPRITTDAMLERDLIAFGAPSQEPQLDVDGNGRVSPLDALLIINAINEYSDSPEFSALAQTIRSDESSLDVDKDTLVTPLDVLVVINQINRMEELAWLTSDESSRRTTASIRVADHPWDLPKGDTLVGDESNSAFDEDTSIARLAWGGEMDPANASQMVLSTVVTGVGRDGKTMVISVDDQGKVSAISDALPLSVSIGEDNSIRVNDQPTGISLIHLDEHFGLAQLSAIPVDWTFVWPTTVDELMSALA
jgi:hypothetical protein